RGVGGAGAGVGAGGPRPLADGPPAARHDPPRPPPLARDGPPGGVRAAGGWTRRLIPPDVSTFSSTDSCCGRKPTRLMLRPRVRRRASSPAASRIAHVRRPQGVKVQTRVVCNVFVATALLGAAVSRAAPPAVTLDF